MKQPFTSKTRKQVFKGIGFPIYDYYLMNLCLLISGRLNDEIGLLCVKTYDVTITDGKRYNGQASKVCCRLYLKIIVAIYLSVWLNWVGLVGCFMVMYNCIIV